MNAPDPMPTAPTMQDHALTRRRGRRRGFVLLEVLAALLLIGIGLLALTKLQGLSVNGSGDAKARTEAAKLSEKKLEELRNIVDRSGFAGGTLATGSQRIEGSNAVFDMGWTVSTPNAGLEQRLVQLRTAWTDAQGNDQRLDLNSLVAWDDPGLQGKLTTDTSASVISPTGEAQRGTGSFAPTLGSANLDGSRIHTDATTKTTYLLDVSGKVLLTLAPKNGAAQSFATISGRIYFDQNAKNNAIPAADNVRVRLSSEGECVFDNRASTLVSASAGSNSYKYFAYTCYVGPGWYGNVGVTVDDSVSGSAASPTICLGDPAFHGGVSDGTLISAHPVESGRRTYRGFKSGTGSYLSTGMGSGSRYGATRGASGSLLAGPFNGLPLPSAYPSSYAGVAPGSTHDYFNQDFLVTALGGQSSCASAMAGGLFTRNAGKYFCINPDNDGATDACPPVWPNFEREVGTGGSINWTLTVAASGNGSGSVASSDGAIACGSACSASYGAGTAVTLTATPASGSVFGGWTGCSSVSGTTCSVSLASSVTVSATFGAAPSTTHALSVTKTGAGSGTVVSGDATTIACGSVCSANVAAGTVVTLNATPASGSTFTGWTGACTGTGACSVTMGGATSVGASFATASSSVTLTVSTSGAATGTASGGGIACGATCSASVASGSSVVLTATPAAGYTFGGWTGCSSASGTSCTVAMGADRSVGASFTRSATCSTPLSGTAHNALGTVTASAYASCAMGSGNTSNYSCTFSAPAGTVITLTNARTSGPQSGRYSYSLSVTATCASQTNVNFP